MPNPLAEFLKRKYFLDEWKQAAANSASLLIWQFRFFGWEITDATAAHGRISHTGTSRLVQATWQRHASPRGLFTVDVMECESKAAAVDTLAEILAESQRAEWEKVPSMGVGDLCFLGPEGGKNALVFLRGNMVTRCLRADHGPVHLDAAAADLDHIYMGVLPAGVQTAAAPEALFPLAAASPLGGEAGNALEFSPALEEATAASQAWYRFTISAGELTVRNGRPVVISSGGEQRMKVQAVTATTLREQEFVVAAGQP